MCLCVLRRLGACFCITLPFRGALLLPHLFSFLFCFFQRADVLIFSEMHAFFFSFFALSLSLSASAQLFISHCCPQVDVAHLPLLRFDCGASTCRRRLSPLSCLRSGVLTPVLFSFLETLSHNYVSLLFFFLFLLSFYILFPPSLDTLPLALSTVAHSFLLSSSVSFCCSKSEIERLVMRCVTDKSSFSCLLRSHGGAMEWTREREWEKGKERARRSCVRMQRKAKKKKKK